MEFWFDSPGQCPGRRPVIAWGEGQRPNPSDAAGCTLSEICRSDRVSTCGHGGRSTVNAFGGALPQSVGHDARRARVPSAAHAAPPPTPPRRPRLAPGARRHRARPGARLPRSPGRPRAGRPLALRAGRGEALRPGGKGLPLHRGQRLDHARGAAPGGRGVDARRHRRRRAEGGEGVGPRRAARGLRAMDPRLRLPHRPRRLGRGELRAPRQGAGRRALPGAEGDRGAGQPLGRLRRHPPLPRLGGCLAAAHPGGPPGDGAAQLLRRGLGQRALPRPRRARGHPGQPSHGPRLPRRPDHPLLGAHQRVRRLPPRPRGAPRVDPLHGPLRPLARPGAPRGGGAHRVHAAGAARHLAGGAAAPGGRLRRRPRVPDAATERAHAPGPRRLHRRPRAARPPRGGKALRVGRVRLQHQPAHPLRAAPRPVVRALPLPLRGGRRRRRAGLDLHRRRRSPAGARALRRRPRGDPHARRARRPGALRVPVELRAAAAPQPQARRGDGRGSALGDAAQGARPGEGGRGHGGGNGGAVVHAPGGIRGHRGGERRALGRLLGDARLWQRGGALHVPLPGVPGGEAGGARRGAGEGAAEGELGAAGARRGEHRGGRVEAAHLGGRRGARGDRGAHGRRRRAMDRADQRRPGGARGDAPPGRAHAGPGGACEGRSPTGSACTGRRPGRSRCRRAPDYCRGGWRSCSGGERKNRSGVAQSARCSRREEGREGARCLAEIHRA
jgi:hypothetical protein